VQHQQQALLGGRLDVLGLDLMRFKGIKGLEALPTCITLAKQAYCRLPEAPWHGTNASAACSAAGLASWPVYTIRLKIGRYASRSARATSNHPGKGLRQARPERSRVSGLVHPFCGTPHSTTGTLRKCCTARSSRHNDSEHAC
jgi:hypothetical protein